MISFILLVIVEKREERVKSQEAAQHEKVFRVYYWTYGILNRQRVEGKREEFEIVCRAIRAISNHVKLENKMKNV